jgi:uncharacterized protein (TIGR03083 family)
MHIVEHVAAIRRDGQSLATAAAESGLDASVPSCPGWVVRDLVRHIGGVHRWAAGILAGRYPQPWKVGLDQVVGAWPPDAELLDWFIAGHSALTAALDGADPGLVCWTFLAAPSPLAMWARRQAHETAVHRVDAELAAGGPLTVLPPEFAADGIDELLACFITRPGGGLTADPPRDLRVQCTDTAGDWLVRISAEGVTTVQGADADTASAASAASAAGAAASAAASAHCRVSGRAADLYLLMWNRQAADALTVQGDGQVLDLFRERVRVRWSRD